ncbi:MAG TPA: hypothetical protein VG317_21080 [Pseudonocardiaceae bacterium]|nr:hypothetical protein [Pseudonocardiaceae bacterium]
MTRQPTDITTVPPCDGTDAQAPAWQRWQADNAVAAGTYHITVNLLVRQDVIVNVRNVDFVRDAARPAPDGDVLSCAGGMDLTYAITADLSTNPPTMRYTCPTACVGTDGFSINATQGDNITVEILVEPGPNALDTWHGSMRMAVGVNQADLRFGTHQIAAYGPNQPLYDVNPAGPPYWDRVN